MRRCNTEIQILFSNIYYFIVFHHEDLYTTYLIIIVFIKTFIFSSLISFFKLQNRKYVSSLFKIGVQRLRDYIKYLDGKGTEPKMADKLEEESEINPNNTKNIEDLLKMSRDLSININKAEQEIQNLAKLLKPVVCTIFTINQKVSLHFK